MKLIIGLIMLLIPMIILAQDMQGMGNVDMQKMMEQMQKMQDCIQKIDQAKLKEFERRAYQMEKEIKALCSQGKRAQAEKKALAFSKEIAKDPTIKKLKKCQENVTIEMPNMMDMTYMEQEKDNSNGHVCD